MKSLVLVLALIGTSLAAQCDKATFQTCQNNFGNALGFPAGVDWTTPASLLVQISNIYVQGDAKGGNGLVAVCNAYNAELACLATAGITPSSCFDPLFLIDNDNDPGSAYFYAMIIKMLQFHCGAGFYPAVDNWQCLQTVYKNSNASLENCMYSFLLGAGADQTNACAYYQNGIQCYERLFRPCNPEVRYYGCESFRQFANVLYYRCGMTCTVQRGPFRSQEEEDGVLSSAVKPQLHSQNIHNLPLSVPVEFQQHINDNAVPGPVFESIF